MPKGISGPPAPTWGFALVGFLAFAFLLSVYVRIWTPEYGITQFLQAGSAFEPRAIPAYRATPKYHDPFPPHRWGFDGQMYAQIALDPLLRDPQLGEALDDPPYRSRRILLPWLAWLGGLGKPFRVLNVYAGLNLLFWLGYVWLLGWMFRPYGWPGLLGFAAMLLTCGVIECMHSSLVDFPSFVLMTTAVALGGTGGAAVLALAVLTREANVLGFVGLARFRPPWREFFRENLKRGLIVVLPLALWVAYVLWVFRHREAGFDGGNLGLPFGGIMGKLGELSVLAPTGAIRWHRWYYEFYKNYELHALLTIISVLTQCLYLVLHRDWEKPLWRMAIVFVPYFLCISFLSWESHFTVTRHALPITLAFNLLLAARSSRAWVVWFFLGNCFVPFGVYDFAMMPAARTPPRPAEYVLVTPDTPGAHPAAAASPPAATVAAPAGRPPVSLAYAGGWSPQQWNVRDTWRWGATNSAVITLRNDTGAAVRLGLEFLTRSAKPRTLAVSAGGHTLWHGVLSPATQVLKLPLDVPPGETAVTFSSPEPATDSDDPPGKFTFLVEDPRLEIDLHR